MIRREGKKVWLDLDQYYPEGHQQPNTVFKSLAIAFRAIGNETSYLDLMGLSAAAFRIQVGGDLCPSSPHPHLGFSCASLAQKALGYRFTEYPWDPKDDSTVRRATDVIVASIERAHPVLSIGEETGLAVGYANDGSDILLRDPYSKKGDEPDVLRDWSGWAFATIDELPHKPSLESKVTSLETAVRLSHENRLLGDRYNSGFAAYDCWIRNLRDEGLSARVGADLPAVILGNAHIYYCLVDARRCASEYLSVMQNELPGKAKPHLDTASETYGDIADRLDSGWADVPWPWQLKGESDWTTEKRRGQAARLEEIAEIERSAVSQLEKALATLG